MRRRLAALAIAGALLSGPGAASADVRGDIERLAESYASLGRVDAAERLRNAVAGFSDAELDQALGQTSGQIAELVDLNVELASQIGVANSSAVESPMLEGPRSAGFPEPSFSASCPESNEVSYDDLLAGRIALTVAKGIWAAASRACDEVIVAIGVGGNVSLVCIIADEILFAAEETFNFIELCNDDIAGARADAVFERTEHIHDDIATHDTEIKALIATIGNKIDLLQGAVDLVAKTQLEQMAIVLGGSRAGVMYTDRLVELCDAAQEAIDDSIALNYDVNPQLQVQRDQGVALIASDPKKAHDLCRDVYRKATRRNARLP
jgi:hypothetical protein